MLLCTYERRDPLPCYRTHQVEGQLVCPWRTRKGRPSPLLPVIRTLIHPPMFTISCRIPYYPRIDQYSVIKTVSPIWRPFATDWKCTMRSVLRLLLQLFLIMTLIVAPNDALVAAQSAGVVTVSPDTGTSRSVVTVSGSGYRPGERVNIRWGAANGKLVGYVNAKPDGQFTGRITVPVADPGSYSIYGVGATSNITGSGVFQITSNTPGASCMDRTHR